LSASADAVVAAASRRIQASPLRRAHARIGREQRSGSSWATRLLSHGCGARGRRPDAHAAVVHARGLASTAALRWSGRGDGV